MMRTLFALISLKAQGLAGEVPKARNHQSGDGAVSHAAPSKMRKAKVRGASWQRWQQRMNERVAKA